MSLSSRSQCSQCSSNVSYEQLCKTTVGDGTVRNICHGCAQAFTYRIANTTEGHDIIQGDVSIHSRNGHQHPSAQNRGAQTMPSPISHSASRLKSHRNQSVSKVKGLTCESSTKKQEHRTPPRGPNTFDLSKTTRIHPHQQLNTYPVYTNQKGADMRNRQPTISPISENSVFGNIAKDAIDQGPVFKKCDERKPSGMISLSDIPGTCELLIVSGEEGYGRGSDNSIRLETHDTATKRRSSFVTYSVNNGKDLLRVKNLDRNDIVCLFRNRVELYRLSLPEEKLEKPIAYWDSEDELCELNIKSQNEILVLVKHSPNKYQIACLVINKRTFQLKRIEGLEVEHRQKCNSSYRPTFLQMDASRYMLAHSERLYVHSDGGYTKCGTMKVTGNTSTCVDAHGNIYLGDEQKVSVCLNKGHGLADPVGEWLTIDEFRRGPAVIDIACIGGKTYVLLADSSLRCYYPRDR